MARLSCSLSARREILGAGEGIGRFAGGEIEETWIRAGVYVQGGIAGRGVLDVFFGSGLSTISKKAFFGGVAG